MKASEIVNSLRRHPRRRMICFLIGAGLLTLGLILMSYFIHAAGDIGTGAFLFVGDGGIELGNDWGWIRRRFHHHNGVPESEWSVHWARPELAGAIGEPLRLSFFILLALILAYLLVLFKGKLTPVGHEKRSRLVVLIGVLFIVFNAVIPPFILWGDIRIMVSIMLTAVLFIWTDRRDYHSYLKQIGQDSACSRCGYDLTGNVSGVCSECGESITVIQQDFLRQ